MAGPSYQVITLSVPAGGWVEHFRRSDYFVALDASAPFKIAFDDYPETFWEKGLKYRAPADVGPFNKFRVYNPTASDIEVKLGLGLGGIDDARFVASAPVEARIVAASGLTTPNAVTLPAGGSAALVAANTARREVGIRNMSLDQRVWLNSVAGQGASGFPLDGKEGVILTTTAAVYAHNSAGVPVEVAVFETEGI